jgi:hypothetical protein
VEIIPGYMHGYSTLISYSCPFLDVPCLLIRNFFDMMQVESYLHIIGEPKLPSVFLHVCSVQL